MPGERVTAEDVLSHHADSMADVRSSVAALRAACGNGWVVIAPDGTLWEGVTLSSVPPMGDEPVRRFHDWRLGRLLITATVSHGPPRWRFPRVRFRHRDRCLMVCVGWRLTALTVGALAPPPLAVSCEENDRAL